MSINSPCIDTGDPDPQYNDPDGTRNDMGAYFYDQRTPAGIGTQSSPYEISTLSNLLWLSETESVWEDGNYFIQTADINASDTQNWNDGAGFSQIGYDYIPIFQGNYNGNNHTIDSLYINRPSTRQVGLFGIIDDAQIYNLGVTNANIMGDSNVGALVGITYYDDSYINNCYSTGEVNANGTVGGLIGTKFSEGLISDSFSMCNVSSNGGNVGGFIGSCSFANNISNCYAKGNVNGIGDNVGGFIGKFEYTSLSDCFSTGDVTGLGDFIGSFIGHSYHSNIQNSYSTGEVVGGSYVGGFVGRNWNPSTISNCVWNNQTTNQSTAIGYSGGTITNLLSCTTLEMQDQSTYTNIGWDFVDETVNGTDDIWDIDANLNAVYR